MKDKPLCAKCADLLRDSGYKVERQLIARVIRGVCVHCGKRQIVDSILVDDKPGKVAEV